MVYNRPGPSTRNVLDSVVVENRTSLRIVTPLRDLRLAP